MKMDNLYKGLRICERYNILNAEKHITDTDIESLLAWRNKMSVLNESQFKKMLHYNGYQENIFSHAVSRNLNDEIKMKYNNEVKTSEWFIQLEEIITSEPSIEMKPVNLGFVFQKFISYTNDRINSGLVFDKDEILGNEAYGLLLNSYIEKLIVVSLKTLTIELNQLKNQNILSGTDSNHRFMCFLKKFEDLDYLKNFVYKNITLYRLIITLTNNFIKNSIEFLNRLYSDKDELSRFLEIDKSEFKVDTFSMDAGDTHNRGKAVTIITLKNKLKFVYKPRNLYANIAYENLVKQINSYGKTLDLKFVKTLSYEDYGYEEFIIHEYCSNESDLQQYYTRFGQLVSLMYVLNATDMHMENVVANGAYPYLIDLETILQSPAIYAKCEESMPDNTEQSYALNKMLFDNVTRIMLLRANIQLSKNSTPIDLSGINGKEQKTNYKVYQPINLTNDNLRFVSKDLIIHGSNNLPSDNVNFEKYLDYVLKGFNDMNFLLLTYRNELQTNTLEKSFKNIKLRKIFRNTNQYGKILDHMHHPDILV